MHGWDLPMNTILVIDDQATEEVAFDALFSAQGFKVHVAWGRDNGLAIARCYLPDLILCHLQSESDGLGLVEALMGTPETQNIPVLYLSAAADFGNQRKVMSAGADDYIVKPFDPEALVLAVRRRMEKVLALKEKLMRVCLESFEAEERPPARNDHILVTIGKRLQLIRYEEIVCITALKEYSKLRTFDGQGVVVRKSLRAWVDLLPSSKFLRIHRSAIINVDAIEKIERSKERSYIVFLRSLREPLEFSQRYSNIMRKTFPS